MANKGTIDQFKANVKSDFARPNLFQVDLAFPAEIIQDSDLVNLGKFTVRAANLPSSQIGVIEVPFRGRVLKIAGDRTFEPWTITIMNDSEFKLRTAMELWASSIQAYNENFTSAGTLGDNSDSSDDENQDKRISNKNIEQFSNLDMSSRAYIKNVLIKYLEYKANNLDKEAMMMEKVLFTVLKVQENEINILQTARAA